MSADARSGARAEGGVSGLVAGAVFNTVEAGSLGLAGSIPVRLRRSDVPARSQAPGAGIHREKVASSRAAGEAPAGSAGMMNMMKT